MSINSVSSYTLSCAVNGTPVSFLIDTGAGVCLIKTQVWERVKSKADTLEPDTSHRLVGVDGIPIKVQGFATVQLTIAGAKFRHKFIIADQIIADAILGIDFLEANKCILNLAKGELVVNDKAITLSPQGPADTVGCAKVTLMDTVIIPASSEMEVRARICSTTKGLWLVEGNEANQSPVCVARALVTTQYETVPLRVVNTGLTPTTLYKNSRIATAEQINESIICQAVEGEEQTFTEGIHENHELVLKQPLPDDITETQREQFIALLSYYSEVLAVDSKDLGRTSVLQHHINTGVSSPIRQPARRIPLPRRDMVRQLLQDMRAKGIISPSKSPWASPIVLVRKKDGTIFLLCRLQKDE